MVYEDWSIFNYACCGGWSLLHDYDYAMIMYSVMCPVRGRANSIMYAMRGGAYLIICRVRGRAYSIMCDVGAELLLTILYY